MYSFTCWINGGKIYLEASVVHIIAFTGIHRKKDHIASGHQPTRNSIPSEIVCPRRRRNTCRASQIHIIVSIFHVKWIEFYKYYLIIWSGELPLTEHCGWIVRVRVVVIWRFEDDEFTRCDRVWSRCTRWVCLTSRIKESVLFWPHECNDVY